MSVYVCGDTHGKIDFEKIWKWNPSNVEHKFLIQLGDWGGLWHDINNPHGLKKDRKHLSKWMKHSKNKNFTLLVVPGNHENWDMIEKLPTIDMFGGKVWKLDVNHHFHHKLLGTIYILQRGEVYTIEGKTFWAFGGALSIDKDVRTLGIDYWEGELPSWLDYEHGMQQLDKIGWNVDYVLTHTCPVNIIDDIIHKTPYTEGKFSDPVAKYFFEIYKRLKFKEWFAGHFHVDVVLDYTDTNDGIFHICYNEIPKRIL